VIELAALPEDTGGQTPDKIKVEVTNDLAGTVSAGDRVEISGVLKTETEDLHTKQNPDIRRPIYLEGRAIQNEQESFAEIEPSRIDEIKELAGEPDIYQQLIDSFAPHIYTTEQGDRQKLAIILALFGGVQKQLPTGSQIRGNINVLLIGDGGTAKSQFLKTAEKLAPKSVLASGKGATAAGLTATAEQSNLTGEWSLKAGALVMADLLREYIAYARQKEPTYASEDVKQRLISYYVDLREQSEDGDEPGPRHNDSLRRLAQASARVRLSEDIEMEDAERAIDMFKFTVGQVGLDEDGNVSGNQLNGGKRTDKSQEDCIENVQEAIRQLEGDNPARIDEIKDRLTGIKDKKIEYEIQKLKQQGEIYEPRTDKFRVS